MNSTIGVWFFFRALRWASCILFFGWALYFTYDRTPHLNGFGHLYMYGEAIFFGSAVLAIFAGFLELMARERTGFDRPRFGQLMPRRY